MMNYNDIFKELDRLTETEKSYICCNDTKNYKMDRSIIICKKCNKTISNILDSPEWRYYGSEDTKSSDPTRCGMPVNVLLPESSVGTVVSNQFSKDKGMYKVKEYQSWTSMTYKERSKYKVFIEIIEVCKKNSLPQVIINEAKSLYKIISDTKISRGNNRKGIIAACIYFACKTCNVSSSSKEIADMFNIKISILTKGCKNFQDILNMSENKNRINKADSIIPTDFIDRFCNRLSLLDKDILNIKKIAKKIHSLNLISDIRPDSFASGCILLYCYNKNLNINKKQIANISKISEVTINKCFKKLENNKNDIFT